MKREVWIALVCLSVGAMGTAGLIRMQNVKYSLRGDGTPLFRFDARTGATDILKKSYWSNGELRQVEWIRILEQGESALPILPSSHNGLTPTELKTVEELWERALLPTTQEAK